MPICEAEVLAFIRVRLLCKDIGIEVGVVKPFSVLPFCGLNKGTIPTNFKGEVVERVWAKRLSSSALRENECSQASRGFMLATSLVPR